MNHTPKLIIVLVVLALVYASSAHGAYQDSKLNAVASAVAGHPVIVSCASSPHEWSHFEDTAGYTFETDGFTFIGRDNVVYLSPLICDTLEADLRSGPTAVGDYWLGRAIKVLLHESSHQAGIADEGAADCNALALVKKYAVSSFGYAATVTRVSYTKVRDGHYKRVTKVVPNPALTSLYTWSLYWHRLLGAAYAGTC